MPAHPKLEERRRVQLFLNQGGFSPPGTYLLFQNHQLMNRYLHFAHLVRFGRDDTLATLASKKIKGKRPKKSHKGSPIPRFPLPRLSASPLHQLQTPEFLHKRKGPDNVQPLHLCKITLPLIQLPVRKFLRRSVLQQLRRHEGVIPLLHIRVRLPALFCTRAYRYLQGSSVR